MIYLDHAATTPVSPEVAQTVVDALTKGYGNPSAQYALGREARVLTDRARESVAGALGARPEQLFFTSCGTRATTGPSGPPCIRTAGWESISSPRRWNTAPYSSA